MNALFRKEIRDAFRWLPLGILLLSLLLLYVCQSLQAPQLSAQLRFATWFAALLYGSFLGLVTFLPDEREAARAFLVHRAISPNQIFRTRILVGLLVYSLGMLIPLAALSVYLASIGPLRLPVSPWQVVPALIVAVSGSIFYFASIVIACRPAHWFGTRIWPLAVAAGGSFLSIVPIGPNLYAWLPVIALSGLSAAWMVFAARHAFIRLPSQVSPTRMRSKSLAMDFILLASSVLLASALGLLPLNFIPQTLYRYPTIEFDKDGTPVYVVRGQTVGLEGTREALESIPISDPSEPKPESIELSNLGTPFMFGPLADASNKFDPTYVHSAGDRIVYFDPAGYLLVYQTRQGFGSMLECVIASDAVTLPNAPRGTPFQRMPRFLAAQNVYPFPIVSYAAANPVANPVESLNQWTIATSDGIKHVDMEKQTIASRLQTSIDSIAFPSAGEIAQMAIRSGSKLLVYKVDGIQSGAHTRTFTLESTLDISTLADGLLSYRDSENWTFLDGYVSQREFHVTRCTTGKTHEYTFSPPRETRMSLGRLRSETSVVFGTLPPLLTLGSLAITRTFGDFDAIAYLPLAIQCLVTLALTVLAARYRGLNARQTVFWVVIAGLLGFGVPLALLAIYPAAVYEICSGCQRRRRVENETCEHCGARWDAAPDEGIEIIESGAIEAMTAVGPA